MKILNIAIKDLWRAFRSLFALAFMFGVPILMTLLFAFLFGGIGGDDSEFTIPKTDVVIVNLDSGSPFVPGFENEGKQFETMGDMLVDTLEGDSFKDLMTLHFAGEEKARRMVDDQEAGLAVIIPQDFTNALIGQGSSATQIEFYKDPELNLGPEIVQSIVMSVVDGFSSGTLTLQTITNVLKEQGVALSQEEQIALMQSLSTGMDAGDEASESSLKILSPSIEENPDETSNPLQGILRSIMAGMMIFYAFFTGTSAAQTILQEEENGTLARLFISPTSTATILNGKFTAGFFMIIVQVTVLLVFANLVLGIYWGSPGSLILAAIGLVALATSFGIFVMSLVKDTKQAGIIFGAVLTFTGMLGISSVFVVGTPIEEAFNFLPLLVPQGWAMNAFKASWQGEWVQTLIHTGGMFLLAGVFFYIGNARFKKRFS